MQVVEALLSCLALLSVIVALVSMGYVWIQGLAHVCEASCGIGRKVLWTAVMLVFGGLGAAVYWIIGYPRSA